MAWQIEAVLAMCWRLHQKQVIIFGLRALVMLSNVCGMNPLASPAHSCGQLARHAWYLQAVPFKVLSYFQSS